jgi:TorA maturation chaperone TorD
MVRATSGEPPAGETPIELLRALAVMVEPPSPKTALITEILNLGEIPTASEHTELFRLELVPYASVYAGAEGAIGGEARDRVAGFVRALGESPPEEADHLSFLLAFYARLAEQENAVVGGEHDRRAAIRRARVAFLGEHLLPWLPPYLDKLADLAPAPYRRWQELLRDVLKDEAAAALGAIPELPLHLRAAPEWPASTETMDPWLDALLAPVVSGIILTRADLDRAGRDLGLGLRAAERRVTLRSFLAQAPESVFRWLASEATTWQARHAAWEPITGDIARFWRRRAERTAMETQALAAAVNA